MLRLLVKRAVNFKPATFYYRKSVYLYDSRSGLPKLISESDADSPLRYFTSGASSSQCRLVSFPLAQTGQGIYECELVHWYVKVWLCE